MVLTLFSFVVCSVSELVCHSVNIQVMLIVAEHKVYKDVKVVFLATTVTTVASALHSLHTFKQAILLLQQVMHGM